MDISHKQIKDRSGTTFKTLAQLIRLRNTDTDEKLRVDNTYEGTAAYIKNRMGERQVAEDSTEIQTTK
jgi:hypothetical protein